MAINIKLSFFILFFLLYFKSTNQELVELGGGGAGGVSISANFFSLLDNIKFTEEEIKAMEEEEDTEG